MTTRWAQTVAHFVVTAFWLCVAGRAATNDSFGLKGILTGPQIDLVTSTLGATKQTGEPNHGGNAGGASLWWYWSPPQSGRVVVEAIGTTFDALVDVYSGKSLAEMSSRRLISDSGPNLPNRIEFSANASDEYSIAVDGRDGASGDVRLKIRLYTVPEILLHPTNAIWLAGTPRFLEVRAIGRNVPSTDPMRYVWRRDGIILPGANEARLSFPVVTLTNAGIYRVAISNSYGGTVSAPAEVRVVRRPAVTRHPGSLTLEDGDTAEFSVEAVGDDVDNPLRYQWEFKPEGGGDFRPIANANSPLLVLTNVITEMIGLYRVAVTNLIDGDRSNPATLDVLATGPRLLSLVGTNVPEQTPLTLKVPLKGGSHPMGFRWLMKTNGSDSLPVLVGTNSSLPFGPARTNQTGFYMVEARNRYRTNSTDFAHVEIEPLPPNDHFTRRIDLTGETNAYYGFNRHGSYETNEPNPFQLTVTNVHSVWWSYRATNDGVITVDLDGSTIDTVLSIHRVGINNTLSSVAENDNFVDRTRPGNLQRAASKVQFPARKGTEYAIMVDGKGGSTAGYRDIEGNKGGLVVKVGFVENLEPFILEGGGGDFEMSPGELGADDCSDTPYVVNLSAVGPFEIAYKWQYNIRCLASSDFETVTEGPRIGPELLSLVPRTNWLGMPCRSTNSWVDIPGATNGSFRLTNLTVAHSGLYRMVAMNVGAAGASTSSVRRLFVSPLPIAVGQPVGFDAMVCETKRLEFRVLEACPTTFQWYLNSRTIVGATTDTFVITNGTPLASGTYQCVARNAAGTTTSQVAQVRFIASPVIQSQPSDLSPVPNECDPERRLEVTVNAPPCAPVNYQWFFIPPGATNGSIIPGETNKFILRRPSASTAGRYYVRVGNPFTNILSREALFPVILNPKIERQPNFGQDGPLTVLAGTTVTNLIRAQSCSPLAFVWRRNGVSVQTNQTHRVGFSVTDEKFVHELVIENISTNDSGSYDVIVSNGLTNLLSQTLDLKVRFRPPNDNFENALSLVSTNANINGTNYFFARAFGDNLFATRQTNGNEPIHARTFAEHSVWWRWTAPTSCVVTIDLAGSQFNTLLGVYTGSSLPELVEVGAGDDADTQTLTSRATVPVAHGRTIQIAIDGTREGPIELNLAAQEVVSAPIITNHPASRAVIEGERVVLSAGVHGSPELHYQWWMDETPLPGATNRSLRFDKITKSNAGVYFVAVTNHLGSAVSSKALLTFGAIVTGTVYDSTTTNPIHNAKVWIDPYPPVFTDEDGHYALEGIEPGAGLSDFDSNKRRVRIGEEVRFTDRSSVAGSVLRCQMRPSFFDFEDSSFQVERGRAVSRRIPMSPKVDGMRIVLSWGAKPADLDAYLEVQGTGKERRQIFHEVKGQTNTYPFAQLDVDAKQGFGPETMSAFQLIDGIYRFYVKNYSRDFGFSASEATVSVYFSDGLYGTRRVPTSGSGAFWDIARMEVRNQQRRFEWLDAVSDTQPSLAVNEALNLPIELNFDDGVDIPKSKRGALPASIPGATYRWDFGDGSPTRGDPNPTTRYARPGEYTVRLEVVAPDGRFLPAMTKNNFIVVYNEMPEVAVTSPEEGRLFKLGLSIPVSANATDADGEVSEVEFLATKDGITRSIGRDISPPYQIPFLPAVEGTYQIRCVAKDDFGESGTSQSVTVVVRDLEGDLLVIENSDSLENQSVHELIEQNIRIPLSDGAKRQVVVRRLQREGLYPELIGHFKAVLWNDSSPDGDIADSDVRLLTSLRGRGVSLYLVGDRLQGASRNLIETPIEWASLIGLRPNTKPPVPMPLRLSADQFSSPRHPLLNQNFGGTVGEFSYERDVEPMDLSITNADVAVYAGEQPVVFQVPSEREPDFGEARIVIQNLRALDGGDDTSKAERAKLLLNATAWVLRLPGCDSIGLRAICEPNPDSVKVGQPIRFATELTHNGTCTLGGVVLSNLFPSNLRLDSYRVVDPRTEEEVSDTIRIDHSPGLVLTRFAEFKRGARRRIEFTATPTQGGWITNSSILRLGSFDSPDFKCFQMVFVDSGACPPESTRLIPLLTQNGEWSIRVTGSPPCVLQLEESSDLIEWQPSHDITFETDNQVIRLGPAQESRKFLRLKTRNP